MPWILQREERECYNNLLADLTKQTDIPGYQIFVTMSLQFFYLIEDYKHHHINKETRKPTKVGLELTITLKHLETGETYKSLQYPWLVVRTTICKFVPIVCRAILAEFQEEYLSCLTTPDGWKHIEGGSELDGTCPMLLGP